MGHKFDVESRFSILDVIGRGAYGVVCAGRDELTGQPIAVKRISGIFEHTTFTKRTLREIRLMRLLQHENLLGIKSILHPVSR